MKSAQPSGKSKKTAVEDKSGDLAAQLTQKVVGQPAVADIIIPYIQMFQAGLAPEGRPVGVFLLLGPTGTGKTKTVEALAEVIHGSEKSLLKVDCGEFQMEHEVAKLIGAPPGYLGHRETQPVLTQQKLNSVTSEKSALSIVLFDEIEKAAPSMTRLLLGVLDKATLRLGDNTAVNFEKSLVFLTSNLGAREMLKEINPDFGFQAGVKKEQQDLTGKLQAIGLTAVRKKFSPEFVNRIDAVITYQPLDSQSLSAILDHQIRQLQSHVNSRLGQRCFTIEVPQESREFLLKAGTSSQYGARELNRTIHRQLTQPLATMVATGQISAGGRIRVDLAPDKTSLLIHAEAADPAFAPHPTVLIVDDNRDLLRFLERLMAQSGWKLLTAETAEAGRELVSRERPSVALLDYVLPDETGVALGVRLREMSPSIPVIIMSGAELPGKDQITCEEHDFQILQKPFLANEIMNQIRARLSPDSATASLP
ncbi:MAG TPA: AAA family ATPase [Bryobacteraceae bacterium]|jgi:ATP-dependent Clp protease ATP-binding subunit ClpA/ActR/RegA family two-component response regulator|nr:AAA family ATPase [Bryobacteraceae bacterium]